MEDSKICSIVAYLIGSVILAAIPVGLFWLALERVG